MSRSNDIANITASVLDGVTAAEVGLGNVDNTSDANKPVSTAQQSAIDLKANIASPTFTGNVALGSNASGTFNGTIGNSASFPAGRILQTVTNTSGNSANGNGEITAVSHSITMSSNTNKILATAIISYRVDGGGGVEKYAGTILKSSGSGVTAQSFYPSVADANGAYGMRMQVNGTGVTPSSTRWGGHVSISYLFSPAYEGPVTITAYMEGYSSTYGIVYVNDSQPARNGGLSTITLMEVVA